MGLRQAIVFVKDLERMASFYRDGLGLEEVSRSQGWVAFAGGVGLHQIPAHIDVDTSGAREDNAIKLVFDADIERLKAAGARLIERPWGGIDGVDPEGNVFGIEKR